MNPIPDKILSYKDKVSFLFQLFIKPGIEFKPSEFKRELVACSRLVKMFPDFDFFYTLNDLTGQFNSLLGLTGGYWKPILLERYKIFLLDKEKNKRYHLSDNVVIEIKTEDKKPNNLMEFLK